MVVHGYDMQQLTRRAAVRRLRRNERGSIVVLVALWLPVCVLMASFVIDVGHWFAHKRHLQLQVDAATIAGGNMFGSCFNFGTGNAAIFSEATKYAGTTGSYAGTASPPTLGPYGSPMVIGGKVVNEQLGQRPVTALYQSARYASDPLTAITDPTAQTEGPCETASLMFDVKATEADLPWFLSAGVVPWINAHARVQLRGLSSAQPDMPLAVPDINPKKVGVTFVNEESGAELSGCTGPGKVTGTLCTFSLTKGTPAGGLSMWSGPATVTLPTAPAKIGLRVGIGGAVGTCAGTSGTAGTWVCYDGSSTSTGLLMIRDYAVGAVTAPSAPALYGVWPTSCSSSPFFFVAAGSCASGVTAAVNYGKGAPPPSAAYHVRATVAGGTAQDLTPDSYDSTRNAWIWSTSAGSPPFAVGSALGAQTVTLSWEINDTSVTIPGLGTCRAAGLGGNPCRGTFANSPHHRFYSGADERGKSGPVRSMKLEGSSEVNGPASLEAGTHALTVTVGLAGNFQVSTPCTPPPSGKAYNCATDRPVALRLKDSSGSTTFAVDCGGIGTGANLLVYEIENGCTNPFSLNSNGICNPANPVTPPDCAPVNSVGVGLKTGPVRTALNNRFAPGGTCLTNNYPIVNSESDKRVVLVMITDFSAFDSGGGSGTKVPVMTMGAFYVTGWEGAVSNCDTQNDAPPGGVADTGEIWGHFINYVLVKAVGGSTICDPDGIVPCVPVLTN